MTWRQRFVRQHNQATDEPLVISRLGDVHIRIEVAAALLERAEEFLASGTDDIEVSIAEAESRLASAEALSTASNAEFELTGQRTALPSTVDDPLRTKYQIVGNYHLNGVL